MLCAYVCSRAARGRVTGVLRASSRATAAKVQMQMTSVIVVNDGRRGRKREPTVTTWNDWMLAMCCVTKMSDYVICVWEHARSVRWR